MIRKLIEWSVYNPLVVILLTLGLVGIGVVSFLNVNVEAYPDPAPPILEVVAQYPGASAEEIERLIAIPLEVAFSGMPGLHIIRTKSLFGLAHLRNQFEYGVDYKEARQEVINRLATLPALPPGVNPQISPQSPTGEIFRYTLKCPRDRYGKDIYTLNDLKSFQDWVLNREFIRIPRIVGVTSTGGTIKRYEIHPDPDRLRAKGITLAQLQSALSNSNQNIGADLLTQGQISLSIRSVGLIGGGLDPVQQVLGLDRQELDAWQDAALAEAVGLIEAGQRDRVWAALARRERDYNLSLENASRFRFSSPLAREEFIPTLSKEEWRQVWTYQRLRDLAETVTIESPAFGVAALVGSSAGSQNPWLAGWTTTLASQVVPSAEDLHRVETIKRIRTAVARAAQGPEAALAAVRPPLTEEEKYWVGTLRRVEDGLGGRKLTPPLDEKEKAQVEQIRRLAAVRASARIGSEENRRIREIRQIVIASNNNIPIKIDDIVEGGPVAAPRELGLRGVVVGHQTRLGKVSLSKPVGADLRNLAIPEQGEIDPSPLWRDEEDKIQCIVLLRKGENSPPALKAVEEKFRELNDPRTGRMLPGVSIETYYDRGDLIQVTSETVQENLLLGIILVTLILLLFLSNVRTALIVAINIPLALLFAFSVLYLRGKSANLLSIGAVDFGIIVDSSVIMVENIYRHLSAGEHPELSIQQRVMSASREITKALFFSTAIMVCAFIPLFTMRGPEGRLFGPMADTYAFALFGALLVALTLSPVLCCLFFKHLKPARDNFVMRFLRSRYLWQLGVCLRYRWITLGFMGSLIVGTVLLLPFLGREFMPQLEEGNLWITATFPLNASMDRVAADIKKARAIMAYPEVEVLVPAIGRPDDGTDPAGFYRVEIFAPLKQQKDWPLEAENTGWRRWLFGADRARTKDELVEVMNAELRAKLVGVDWNFSQYIRDNVTEDLLAGVKGDNSVKIFGPDLNRLEMLAAQVKNILREVPGIQEVGIFNIKGQSNLEFRIDPNKCSRWGVMAADVNNLLQSAVGGKALTSMIEGEKIFDITLRWPHKLRSSETSILDMMVDVTNNMVYPAGGTGGAPTAVGSGVAPPSNVGAQANTANPLSNTPRIPLRELVSPVGANGAPDPNGTFERAGASTIYREQGKRMIAVKFNVRNRDLASAVAETQERTAHLFEAPYHASWAGEFNEMQEAERRLMFIIPLALGLIVILLYMAFRSLLDTVVVLSNVIALTMGGIWALLLTGTNFSISAAVGFISLFGVAIMDGLLLISSFNALRAHGVPLTEVILTGAGKRVRAVMMTALTAILGLLPAALSTRIGAQTQRPLAIVVVGGMITTLILTRYLMPVLYSFYGDRQPPTGSEDLAH